MMQFWILTILTSRIGQKASALLKQSSEICSTGFQPTFIIMGKVVFISFRISINSEGIKLII